MGSPETLEQWAARVGPTLDAEGWRAAKRDSKHRFADILAEPEEPRRFTVGQARALLAFRDKVAAGLIPHERDVLTEPMEPRLWEPASVAAAAHLRALRLHAWKATWRGRVSARTPFGDEVARVLEGRDGG